MKKKELVQVADLDIALENLDRIKRLLLSGGEPVLSSRVGSIMQDLVITLDKCRYQASTLETKKRN